MGAHGLILGIETSCDETAAAVVAGGRRVLSNVVASQIALHAAHGGVVPEIASRAHVERIAVVIRQALSEADVALAGIDAIAVTAGPGLIGALLVGVETAKAMSLGAGKPFVAAHHVRAHLYSPFLESRAGAPRRVWLTRPPSADDWGYPYLGLAISGGHSSLARVESPTATRQLGETRDDAVGEAYDKVAKLLGLGYPGGPIIDRLAAEGDPARYPLPRPMLNSPDHDFSFSGLKTAVRLLVEKESPSSSSSSSSSSSTSRQDSIFAPSIATDHDRFIRDLCAAFQAAVIEVLLTKARRAAQVEGLARVAIVGGVACNRGLRQAAAQLADTGLSVVAPEPALCGDNAAMVAGLGYHLLAAGQTADLTLNPRASMGV